MSFRTFTGVLSQGVGADPIWINLISYYNCDGDLLDSKGTDDATGTAITYDTGINLSGASLNGSTSKIDFPTKWSFDYDTPFSFSYWFKRDNTSTGVYTMLSNIEVTGLIPAIIDSYLNANTFFIQIISDNSDNKLVKTKTAFANNTNWNHLVVTYDGSTNASGLKVYLNSVEQTMNTTSDTLSSAIVGSNNFTLGQRDSTSPWIGDFDEVGVWDTELVQADVDELWNSGTGKFYP